jgi:putative phosphoribosyl transferase
MNRKESIQDVRIPINGISLDGELRLPADPLGVVVFAHGSGSSRFSSRNKAVAELIRDVGVDADDALIVLKHDTVKGSVVLKV